MLLKNLGSDKLIVIIRRNFVNVIEQIIKRIIVRNIK